MSAEPSAVYVRTTRFNFRGTFCYAQPHTSLASDLLNQGIARGNLKQTKISIIALSQR